jgi:hypothetical protein
MQLLYYRFMTFDGMNRRFMPIGVMICRPERLQVFSAPVPEGVRDPQKVYVRFFG